MSASVSIATPSRPTSPSAHRVVAVVAHQSRHVEIGRDPGLALADQELEAAVGVLAGAEAGDLAHGPIAAAIHRRVRPAGEGIAARQADVLDRRAGYIGRGVGPFYRNVAKSEELLLALRRAAHKLGNLIGLPVADLLLERRSGNPVERL